MTTLRQRTLAILRGAHWDLPLPSLRWSPRLTRCAGLFILERDARGILQPEIRLSIPLLRRPDRPWPLEVCGAWCHDPDQAITRILEHELIHYWLWRKGERDWGHTERFRQVAWETFGHQSITHGIGSGD